MKLIAGLGNPGKKYKRTRHNMGFMVVDRLQEELQPYDPSSWSLSNKFNAEISGCTIKGEKHILAKPMTYMNKSGQAIQLIGQYYNMTPKNLIVIHDDVDIGFGEIKVQQNKGAAGHKGVQSIINRLKTKHFTRVRVGIANDKMEKMDTSDFVLSKFGWLERSKLKRTIDAAVDKVKSVINIK